MTLQEMIEAAQLEALGLLDEDEQRAFEDAFASAKPGVQGAVRAEQARWAKTPGELISAEPPASLRDRVLAAVGEAMGQPAPAEDLTESRLRQEIIGSIGPSNRLLGAPIAGRVSPGWRAGALGLAAAAAVLLVAFLYVADTNERLKVAQQGERAMQDLTTGYGASLWHDAVFNTKTQRCIFESTPLASKTAKASLYCNADWKQVHVFAEGLTVLQGQSYRVVLLNDDNTIERELADVGSDGQLVSRGIALDVREGMRVAIVAAPRNQAVADDAALLLVATIKLG